MRKLHIITFLSILVCCTFSFSQNFPTNYSSESKIYSGLLTGYNGGFGIQGNVTISILQKALPVSVRLGIGYTSLNPGKPEGLPVGYLLITQRTEHRKKADGSGTLELMSYYRLG